MNAASLPSRPRNGHHILSTRRIKLGIWLGVDNATQSSVMAQLHHKFQHTHNCTQTLLIGHASCQKGTNYV